MKKTLLLTALAAALTASLAHAGEKLSVAATRCRMPKFSN